MFAAKRPSLARAEMKEKLLTIVFWIAACIGALDRAEAQAPAPNATGSPAYREALARAEKGDAVAQFNIAMMLVGGKDVERNLTNAAAWLQKSAQAGNVSAQFNLAVFYTQGAGVPQDFTEAAK